VLVAGFPAGPPATNCWVVAPGAGEQCVVIDPGIAAEEQLDEVLAEHRLQPVAVLLTHGHLDHTFAVVPVCGARGVAAYVHPADRAQLRDPWSGLGIPVGTPLFGRLTFAEPDDVRPLADGDVLRLAGLELSVELAPGHTPGSLVFRTGHPVTQAGRRFDDDLLVAGSVGRVDLPGGSAGAMAESLARVVLPLPDATVVHPGHGPDTTIGRERTSNPYLQGTFPQPARGR